MEDNIENTDRFEATAEVEGETVRLLAVNFQIQCGWAKINGETKHLPISELKNIKIKNLNKQ